MITELCRRPGTRSDSDVSDRFLSPAHPSLCASARVYFSRVHLGLALVGTVGDLRPSFLVSGWTAAQPVLICLALTSHAHSAPSLRPSPSLEPPPLSPCGQDSGAGTQLAAPPSAGPQLCYAPSSSAWAVRPSLLCPRETLGCNIRWPGF